MYKEINKLKYNGTEYHIVGVQGPMGPQGIQGEIGPQGPKGEKGDQGEQGPKGLDGQHGDWEVLTSTQYSSLSAIEPNKLYLVVTNAN